MIVIYLNYIEKYTNKLIYYCNSVVRLIEVGNYYMYVIMNLLMI